MIDSIAAGFMLGFLAVNAAAVVIASARCIRAEMAQRRVDAVAGRRMRQFARTEDAACWPRPN